MSSIEPLIQIASVHIEARWRRCLKGACARAEPGKETVILTHQLMGTQPWKPVREKKQEWWPNSAAKKMELANTKVLKNTSILITGSSSPGLHQQPHIRHVLS